MNTTKQVNVMIGLLFMSLLVFGAYIVTEPAREAMAREEQAEMFAKRGAEIFVANCRSCHGLHGRGPDDGGIAPALNNVAFLVLDEGNPFGLAPTPAGEVRSIHDFIFNTVACGRSNTAMPLWAERYGGPLSDTRVNYLAALIMQSRWDLVEEIGHHHDEPLIEQHSESIAKFGVPYDDPRPSAESKATPVQQKAVDAAITAGTATHFEALNAEQQGAVEEALKFSILAPDPAALGVTTKNCGQYGAAVLEFRERNPLSSEPTSGGSPAGADDPVKAGQAVATQFGCVACHSNNGNAGVGPTWKGLGGSDRPLVSGGTVKADDAYLQESIADPNAKVTKGFNPNVMPATFGTQLSTEQIGQVIAYINSLK